MLLAGLMLSGHRTAAPMRTHSSSVVQSAKSDGDKGSPNCLSQIRKAINQMQNDVTSCLQASSAASRKELISRVQQDEKELLISVEEMSNWSVLGQTCGLVDSIFVGVESFRVNCSIAIQMVHQRRITNARNSLLQVIEGDSRITLAKMNDLVSEWNRYSQPRTQVTQTENHAALLQTLLFLPLAAFGFGCAYKQFFSRVKGQQDYQPLDGSLRQEMRHLQLLPAVELRPKAAACPEKDRIQPQKPASSKGRTVRKSRQLVQRTRSPKSALRLEKSPVVPH